MSARKPPADELVDVCVTFMAYMHSADDPPFHEVYAQARGIDNALAYVHERQVLDGILEETNTPLLVEHVTVQDAAREMAEALERGPSKPIPFDPTLGAEVIP